MGKSDMSAECRKVMEDSAGPALSWSYLEELAKTRAHTLVCMCVHCVGAALEQRHQSNAAHLTARFRGMDRGARNTLCQKARTSSETGGDTWEAGGG